MWASQMEMDIQSLCCHCTMLGTNTHKACPLVLQLYISCFVIFVRHLKECHKIKYVFLLWIDKDVLDVKLLSFCLFIWIFIWGNYSVLFQNVIFKMTSPFVFPVIKLAFVWHMILVYRSIFILVGNFILNPMLWRQIKCPLALLTSIKKQCLSYITIFFLIWCTQIFIVLKYEVKNI